MSKRLKLVSIILSLVLMTSCVGRRLDSMKSKRAMREYDNSGIILSDGSFFPDKITGFTVDEYLKWYKNLNEPLRLQVPKAQRPKELSKEERLEDFDYFFNQIQNVFCTFIIKSACRLITD